MTSFWIWTLAIVAGLAALIFGLRWLYRFNRAVQAERARELFRLQRERLETLFMQAAVESGKPRGLIWKHCDWEDRVTFARERQSGQIAALVGVTIQFEAVVGGDMEGLPAVGNLRNASAVFFFHKGHWSTVGKAVFNMNPDEAMNHFQNQYEVL